MKKLKTEDLITTLRTIMEAHTEHYQSDFNMDVNTLTSAARDAKNTRLSRRTFLWMVRISGTWCFCERNVFIKNTWEHNVWTYYMDQEPGKILAYRIEVDGMENGKIAGSICKVNYLRHSQYVDRVAVPVSQNRLIFEKGERVQPATQRLPIREDEELGELVSFEPIPEDTQKLEAILCTVGDSKNWSGSKLRRK